MSSRTVDGYTVRSTEYGSKVHAYLTPIPKGGYDCIWSNDPEDAVEDRNRFRYSVEPLSAATEAARYLKRRSALCLNLTRQERGL